MYWSINQTVQHFLGNFYWVYFITSYETFKVLESLFKINLDPINFDIVYLHQNLFIQRNWVFTTTLIIATQNNRLLNYEFYWVDSNSQRLKYKRCTLYSIMLQRNRNKKICGKNSVFWLYLRFYLINIKTAEPIKRTSFPGPNLTQAREGLWSAKIRNNCMKTISFFFWKCVTAVFLLFASRMDDNSVNDSYNDS